MTETCPGCGGPITFSADDSDGVTVNFHCPEPTCEYGKHPTLNEGVRPMHERSGDTTSLPAERPTKEST